MLINEESEYNLIEEAMTVECGLAIGSRLNINIWEISGNAT